LLVCKENAGWLSRSLPAKNMLDGFPAPCLQRTCWWGFGANYIAQQIVPRGGETIFAAAILISEKK
jgi:hypothetical protein